LHVTQLAPVLVLGLQSARALSKLEQRSAVDAASPRG
jgi:hypothetical protein